MQAGLDLLVVLERRVTLDQVASLDCKAHQAHKEMLERREILEHKARMDSQDHRVQLVNLETQVSLVRLDGLGRQDLKDKLASLAHKVVKRCTLNSLELLVCQNHSSTATVSVLL